MPDMTTAEALATIKAQIGHHKVMGAQPGASPARKHIVAALRMGAEALEQAADLRDRHADLQVYCADLRDLLQQMFDHRGGQIEDNGKDDWDPDYHWWIKDTPLYAKVRAVLQVDGAGHGRQSGGQTPPQQVGDSP